MSPVELYYLSLKQHGFDEDLEAAIEILDAHEISRYRRYKNDHAKNCFLQARRICKSALSQQLGCEAAEVKFSYSETEKPFLKKHSACHFNISHSHSYVVVAISAHPVGVDVEDVDRCQAMVAQAGEFLNDLVAEEIIKAPSTSKQAAIFAEHWVCMESYTKLKGSAIYREKGKVIAEQCGKFSSGSLKRFENCLFVLFSSDPAVRISIATECDVPAIKTIDWRTKIIKTYDQDNFYRTAP